MYEKDGAWWLRTTAHGDDKDRVLIKSDGNAAYFAADLAYYLDKRERGADCAVYLLGADHHGYIGRMMAMCAAFGDTPGTNMQILIGQLVNLVRNGVPVRMSKRAGTFVTLRDVVEQAGRIVGYAGLRALPNAADGDIQTIALDASVRGRGQGRTPRSTAASPPAPFSAASCWPPTTAAACSSRS